MLYAGAVGLVGLEGSKSGAVQYAKETPGVLVPLRVKQRKRLDTGTLLLVPHRPLNADGSPVTAWVHGGRRGPRLGGRVGDREEGCSGSRGGCLPGGGAPCRRVSAPGRLRGACVMAAAHRPYQRCVLPRLRGGN